MSNTSKNTAAAATPKTVAEAKAEGAKSNAETDALIENNDVVGKAEKKTVPAQSTGETTDPQDGEATLGEKNVEKLTVVQRLKAAAEKLKQNKKALLILGGAAVVVGLTIKNNRKDTGSVVEDDVVEETTEIENPDDTTDSL